MKVTRLKNEGGKGVKFWVLRKVYWCMALLFCWCWCYCGVGCCDGDKIKVKDKGWMLLFCYYSRVDVTAVWDAVWVEREMERGRGRERER